jgi:hypothetical protein
VPYAFVGLFIGGLHKAVGFSKGWPINAGINNETGGADPIQQYKLMEYLVEGNDLYSPLLRYTGSHVEGQTANADWTWLETAQAPQSRSGYTYTWHVPLGGTDALLEDYVVQGQGYAPLQNVFGGSLRSYKCAGEPCDDDPEHDCKGSTLCTARISSNGVTLPSITCLGQTASPTTRRKVSLPFCSVPRPRVLL